VPERAVKEEGRGRDKNEETQQPWRTSGDERRRGMQ